MQFGICHLSIVPVRFLADHSAELITQLLYGDIFKVKESRKYWLRIEIAHDGQEGWIDKKQLKFISQDDYLELSKRKEKLSIDFVSNTTISKNIFQPLVVGSRVDICGFLGHQHEGEAIYPDEQKQNLVNTALIFLNAPYLWGGKTPLGIDASGLTQMVYKLNGHTLFRTTEKQATQGEALSFIEESEPGDLAFFDNNEGTIDHVGIILKDNYIIHAHGHVRVDRIDHTGIFNTDEKMYSHKLRVIKKII